MIFFNPTDAFIDWLISYAKGRIIIDLGSGEGYLIHLLNQRKVNCIGIEPYGALITENKASYSEYNFPTPSNIIGITAQLFLKDKKNNCLLVCARPDHSGWVSEVIKEATDEILYIGLKKNVTTDLGDSLFKILRTPELKEEIVLSITPTMKSTKPEKETNGLMEFILIERKPVNKLCESRFEWWNRVGDKLYNQEGGWNVLDKNDTVLETVYKKNWHALFTPENTAKTSEYKDLVKNSTRKELKAGWLSPEGRMHYCIITDHIRYAHVVLGVDVPELERIGWLHIYKDMEYLRSGKRMTQAQATTAREELGLKVSDEDILHQ